MTSLAVVDPIPLLRASLAAMASSMGFSPVEEAADLPDLVRRGEHAPRPDLMLIGLPQGSLEITRRMQDIRAWAPEVKVIFVAAALDVRALIGCFAAGARGYLIENISREGLKHSLRLVSAGENVFPSELADTLTALSWQIANAVDAKRELEALQATEREVEVLRCLTRGESNNGIATKLGIPEPIVMADMRHILKKLHVANRTQAALWAVANGLAPPMGAPAPPRGSRRQTCGRAKPEAALDSYRAVRLNGGFNSARQSQ
jgi:two-component system nitrate/nitrite response regulator NarL